MARTHKVIREIVSRPLLVLGDSWIREGDPKSVGFAIRVAARVNAGLNPEKHLLPVPILGLGGARGLLPQIGAILQLPKGGVGLLVLGIEDARSDTPIKGWVDATMVLIELLAARVCRLMIVIPCFAPEISTVENRGIGSDERRWIRRATNILRERLDESFAGHSKPGSCIQLQPLEGFLEDFKDQLWPSQHGYELVATEIAQFIKQS